MFTLSIKIERKPRKLKEITSVSCFHCGKSFTMHIKNIRTANYCSTCK